MGELVGQSNFSLRDKTNVESLLSGSVGIYVQSPVERGSLTSNGSFHGKTTFSCQWQKHRDIVTHGFYFVFCTSCSADRDMTIAISSHTVFILSSALRV